MSLEAKILLLDEPTASITDHETAALFNLLRKMRDDGAAIVFVSHKLGEVFALADRVTVLRDGKNVATRAPMVEMTRRKPFRTFRSLAEVRQAHARCDPVRSAEPLSPPPEDQPYE